MTPDDHLSLISDANLDAGRGEDIALIDGDDVHWTYRQVHAAICRFAAALQARGVRRGERVLLVLGDSIRFHAAFLGSIRAGAVPVPYNFLARAEDFAYALADSYAVLAVVDQAFLDKVAPAADALGVPVLVGGGPPEREDERDTVEAWIADGPDHVDPVPTHADDPAFWLYSSGSTGRPKGVVHAHHDVAVTCRSYAVGVLGLTAADRTLSSTPLFHAYGLGNGLTFPMWVGATAVQMDRRPTPDAVLARVQTRRPSVLFSVPALYNGMLARPDAADHDLTSLRLNASAAEALPAALYHGWKALTGTEILDGIGSTEMLHIYCSNRAGAVVPGTSGTPVPGYALQLRDEHGDVLDDPEASGELYVSGDSALMLYWHHREKTRSALHGPWFRTGDRYRRGADGTYTYEGRADDMLKVKGLWVSPIEIENRLIEHDAVREAAVVGVTREGMVRIKAYVILVDPGAPVGDADEGLRGDLQQWCKAKLLRYQFPHEVEVVADFPRTSTGKVQRFVLRGRG